LSVNAVSSGYFFLQISMACSQRGWKGQQSGMSIRLGGAPEIEYNLSRLDWSSRGTDWIKP
jgi:hypothetical protein